jgi:hypothetical protein
MAGPICQIEKFHLPTSAIRKGKKVTVYAYNLTRGGSPCKVGVALPAQQSDQELPSPSFSRV